MRKILVRLTGETGDDNVLKAAIALGSRFGAEVGGVYVRPTKASAILDSSPVQALGAVLGGGKREAFDPQDEALQSVAKAGFARASTGGDFQVLTGLSELAHTAALADLLVETGDWPEPDTGSEALFHILGETGRPVLLPGPAGEADLSVVVLAWDGSLASARALASATPLLAKAGRVIVLHEAGAAAEVLTPARRRLALHGIEARFEPIELPSNGPAATVAAKVESLGAGVLAMGAYRHSHLEEELFGGFTQDMLAERRFALLLRR